MNWQVRVHRSLAELGGDRWPDVSGPAGLYGTALWLRNMEGVLEAEPYYLSAWRPGARRPAAAMPCALVHDRAAYLFYNPPRLLLDEDVVGELAPFAEPASRFGALAAELRPLRERLYPALLGVSPFGYVAALCFDGAGEEPGARDALLDAFTELGGRLGAALLAFPYLRLPEQAALSRALAARGFHGLASGGLCSLDLCWPDLDGYLRRLPSTRRRSALAEMRAFADAGGTVALEPSEVLDERLAAIELAHQRRFTTVLDPSLQWLLTYYAHLRADFGSCLRVFVARAGDRPVAFVVAYEHDGVLYCKQVAVDHAAAPPLTYFNVGYYGPLRYALGAGVRRVEYGMGAYEAKLLRGCRLDRMEARLRCCLPAAGERLGAYLDAYSAAQGRRLDALGRYAHR